VNDQLLWLRLLGAGVIVVALVAFDSSSNSLWQSLALPLLLAAGALAMVRNLAAVALGTAVLALIHSNPDAANWVPRIAYPVIAGAAGCVLLGIAGQRFRRRIRSTREQRWASRQQHRGTHPGGSRDG